MAPFFRVIDSTLSPQDLGEYIADRYQLSDEATCKILLKGINDTYTVTDGNTKFIFRVYSHDWRTKKEIEEEISLLQLLYQNGISVSYPLADKAENMIQEFNAPEGSRYGMLFSFANGQKVRDLTDDQCFRSGELMAKMHRLTEGKELQRVLYNAASVVEYPLRFIKPYLKETSAEYIFLEAARNFLVAKYDGVDVTKVRHGVVHFDFAWNNLHFTDSGMITLFDFDFCGNGWLCHDVAYFILLLFLTNKEPDSYTRKMKNFLAGYEEHTKLTETEKSSLPFLGLSHLFFYLGIQCLRHDTWSNRFLTETYLKNYINDNMKRWDEYNFGNG